MTRSQLEHIIRAAAGIVNENELVIIGSQAVLGQFPDAPDELLRSIEADIYPERHPEKAIEIDGAIGERSLFHETHGYYAHGVGPETAVLPKGWEQRTVSIKSENTGGAEGKCLEVHDLAVSKLVAGRERDLDFVRNLVRVQMMDPVVFKERLGAAPVDPELSPSILARLSAVGL
jgi:hypothetical protein